MAVELFESINFRSSRDSVIDWVSVASRRGSEGLNEVLSDACSIFPITFAAWPLQGCSKYVRTLQLINFGMLSFIIAASDHGVAGYILSEQKLKAHCSMPAQEEWARPGTEQITDQSSFSLHLHLSHSLPTMHYTFYVMSHDLVSMETSGLGVEAS